MKDAAGAVLYVGKAANLRSRVRSHFQAAGDLAPRSRLMLPQVADVEIIATDSEVEALILESNLIKRHRPPFNVRLRDDKKYPYIKITLDEPFPAMVVVRDMEPDKARYFGPYASTKAMWQTIRLIGRLFGIRPLYVPSVTRKAGCPWRPPKPLPRPCLYYYIHECTGPCAGLIPGEEYRANARQAAMFLEGSGEDLIRALRQQMDKASQTLQFETAARLRDQIRALERSLEEQKAVMTDGKDADVLGHSLQEDQGCVAVLQVRKGKLVGQDQYMVQGVSGMQESQALAGFIEQYYQRAATVPPTVLLPLEPDDRGVLEDWLASRRGARVSLSVPKRGIRRNLVQMACSNARIHLTQELERESAQKTRGERAVADLQAALNLPRPPRRIEGYDISNIAGAEAVGSMVVFEGGAPKKSEYRRFKVRLSEGAPDDVGMMREILERRLKAAAGSPRFARLPDLMLVDGGKPQLNAAVKAMHQLALSLPCAALAKRHEEVFLPGRRNPVLLPQNSRALYLLQQVRDEAHRFAQSYHHTLRSRTTRESMLDRIPGIGPTRKKQLLAHFRSIERLRQASLEEIASVAGIGQSAARTILAHLREMREQ